MDGNPLFRYWWTVAQKGRQKQRFLARFSSTYLLLAAGDKAINGRTERYVRWRFVEDDVTRRSELALK
ncbi:hypothetical protein F8388_008087 [Cannabis sativa]|uniref:Uncharacterized protein n=1 Tax=Cannabis sativa TaxID=3483 RepID=A0A7J6EC75_CANSA|nr:hypothetical protein F8388_008087 [Cannabis sativa]